MNLKLITMFNVMPKAEGNFKRSFEEVNTESAKYGWIIHPDCCSTLALDWVKAEAKTNYNKTFYAKWSDITSKTRFELLVDQLLHYASTYGTNYTGDAYIPNNAPDVEIPYNSFKVIMPATDEEIYTRCVKMLQSGIALETETINVLVDFITQDKRFKTYGLDVDSIKNKEASIALMDATGIYGKDPFNMLRYFVFKATGSAMLIKDRKTINTIKEKAETVDFTKLSEEQLHALASIFYRFKPLFLAFKNQKADGKPAVFKNEAFRKAAAKLKAVVVGQKTNSSVINHIRRLAVTDHKPFTAGFWETVLSEHKKLDEVRERLAKGEITNFKKVTLMQGILAKLQNASGKMYVIRNGKMWIRKDAPVPNQELNSYLMVVYNLLEDSLVKSIKDKACTVRYPQHVNLTMPTSEKNFIGNYPFGTSVDMSDDHNVVGIYWRGEWGTQDFDLHMADINGGAYGWNASYKDSENKIIYSGDMTTARPEATELFYIDCKCPDGKVSVNQYNGSSKSQFKFFVARQEKKIKKDGYYSQRVDVKVDPNNVLAEFIIPVDNEREKQCALIVDNKVFLMDLTQGGGRVPNHEYADVYIENLKNKCRSFIDLKPILEKAGFTFVDDSDKDSEVGLDLTQLSKDTLIDLFSETKK